MLFEVFFGQQLEATTAEILFNPRAEFLHEASCDLQNVIHRPGRVN
jgi:hypothetical protein